jgi:hypothetical protein
MLFKNKEKNKKKILINYYHKKLKSPLLYKEEKEQDLNFPCEYIKNIHKRRIYIKNKFISTIFNLFYNFINIFYFFFQFSVH